MTHIIKQLIINSPYREPDKYWLYHAETRAFTLESGRRPAGYVVASETSRNVDDPGRFVPIELVNRIRPLVTRWRHNGYPGATSLTRRLLAHWHNPEAREGRRFFFCQLEAIETLIWLAETPESQTLIIPGDGGAFARACCKMATGTGKTIVMALLVAWQTLNHQANPSDARFSRNFLVVAPGLTVKKRLQVLLPAEPGNYYEVFNIAPPGQQEALQQARLQVVNWQALAWETEEKIRRRKSVDKRGPKSDQAYARDVLGQWAHDKHWIVINDEAHHAWRASAEAGTAGTDRAALEEATVWVGGLDRLHRACGIRQCYDFSATPFAPSGRRHTEESLFGWIVSDFGLNDAIEAGLVKTPRVVVRDDGLPDAKTYRSKLYHIYRHIQDDLNRKALPNEALPDLLNNAYLLLGRDWLAVRHQWEQWGLPTPPVMITVANRTETAARIKYAFDNHKIQIPELCDPARTLHIDSKVLELAESQPDETLAVALPVDEDGEAPQKKLTKVEQAELLRRMVDTVGKVGEPGELIQNVISVGMLSEGWDAKTVTHIMGLRAFSSQLLCEQVIGRGLRRTSYDTTAEGLFAPEYVNIFGVPFTFIPHEEASAGGAMTNAPTTRIQPDPAKADYALAWPNVIRVERVYQPQIKLDFARLGRLDIDAADQILTAEMAGVVGGKPHLADLNAIDLRELGAKYRLQTIIFQVAREALNAMPPAWRGLPEQFMAQLIRLTEQFIASPKLVIRAKSNPLDPLEKRILLILNMRKVVQHITDHVHFEHTQTLVPVFDDQRPLRSTADMPSWYTSRPVTLALRSHINYCPVDSTWEVQPTQIFDRHPKVQAWAKNDHLGLEIGYFFAGEFHNYRPDFIVRLTDNRHLLLEIKGRETERDRVKRTYCEEWAQAITHHGGFGEWLFKQCADLSTLADMLHNL